MLKTKYKPIMNIRKQSVKKIENELMQINYKIQNIKEEIVNLENEIPNSTIPQSGNFALIISIKESITVYRLEIDRKKDIIKIIETQKEDIKQKLIEANMEYEKVKHLHDVEVQTIIKIRKKKEEEEMNEIALMLFNGKKN